MKVQFANDVVESFIDGMVELISKGKYALTSHDRAAKIAEYIKDKIIFIEAGAEDASPLSGYLVYYSDSEMMIPSQMDIEDIRVEIIRKVLNITLMEISKDDSITSVDTGYLSLMFMGEDNSSAACSSIIDKEINNDALIVYSRFLNAYMQNKCTSLDDFITKELAAQDAVGYSFMRISNAIGNELVFKAFKTSDLRELDDYLNKYGVNFAEIADAFEKDYNLEFVRCIINRIEGAVEQSGVNKRLLTRPIFDELFESFKMWLTAGLMENQIPELITAAREYFFEGFEARFGTEIDIGLETEKIKAFYNCYFKINADDKLNFFKGYNYGKKYRKLKEQSFDLVIRSFNANEPAEDISFETRKVLAEVEKLNKRLEREPREIQKEYFEVSGEILLDCMSLTTGDKSVLGREAGELARIFELVNES